MKINILVQIFTCFLLSLIISCSDQKALDKYNCEVLGFEVMSTFKKTIYIQIPNKLTELQLSEIAAQLRDENSFYDRLFIFYLLPDMKIGNGAWATTHYNTDLVVNIIGVDNKIEEMLKTVDMPEGEIIGKWYDNSPYIENSVIIYKVHNQLKMIKTYRDGSKSEQDLKMIKNNGELKYVFKNDFDEYLIIESDRRLGLYDNEGLISIAEEIK